MQRASTDESAVRKTLLELATLEKRDYQAALQRILQADSLALEVDRVSYWRLSDDGGTLTNELCFDRRFVAFESGARLYATQYPGYFRALRDEQVILAHDARRDPRTRELAPTYLAPLRISSMMDVPVWSHGQLVGVLCHENVGPPRTWTADECDLSLAVAQTIATAVEASARHEAEKVARRALFLSDATEALSEILEPEQVPRRIAELSVEQLADWCSLDEIDEWGQLRCLAAKHRDPERQSTLELLMHLKPRRTTRSQFVARVLAKGRSLLFPAVTDDVLGRFGIVNQDALGLVERCGAKSAMVVPLAARGRVSGALTLVSADAVFGQEDLRLAEEFARRAAVHVDNVRLYREAREAVRARDEFIAIASHELNTPLTSMGLSVDALERGVLSGSPEAVRRAVALIQRQQRRLARLIREMLDATRIQSQRLVLRREPMDLGEMAREVCASYEPALAQEGTELVCSLDPGVRGVWDRARLERVLENLLSNAGKFGRGRPIEVRVERTPNGAALRVVDHGVGIPLERQARIFERFERAGTKEHPGLGLGLYIARGIVHAHGGEISVHSRPGAGATFTVRLPAPARARGASSTR